tara:strand:+ start:7739 stop:8800 length:1062 start_codon:yes stop_codon:yes gene_type:complete
MKTIVTITGIRPDFIRMSKIFNKLDEADWCNHILIHTGQHYDELLSGVFFDDLKIRRPDFNLHIGGSGKKHYQQQAELGTKTIELFEKESIKPDLILFLGDSNSALASVPLRKEGYEIGHIEAGMRSYDDRMLEEINRKVCDHVSSFLFVYHENYKQKAMREGIAEGKIHVVGNTIVEPLTDIIDVDYHGTKEHILMDIHRPENFKYPDRMKKIIELGNLCIEKTGKPVKMLNFGRTMSAIKNYGLELGNIEVVELMGYRDFVRFMQDSLFIISDSGTAQEEPALLKVPVLVPREFTERPESVENKNSVMVDLECQNFQSHIDWATSDYTGSHSWLGDGSTSDKIINIIRESL